MRFFYLLLSIVIFTHTNSKSQTCASIPIDLAVFGNNLCEGELVNFAVVLLPGGLAPDGIFSWTCSNGILPPNFPNNTSEQFIDINPFSSQYNGTYTVIYTDASGCTSVDSEMVFVNPKPSALITQTTACYGISLTANDLANTTGPLSYYWLETGQTTNSITYVNAGGMGSNQSVIITNAAGCSDDDFTGLLSPIPLSISITGGSKITPGGTMKLTANSNYPVFSFKWYKNSVLIAGATSNQLTVTDTGQYRLRIKSVDGCIKTAFRRIVYRLPRIEDDNSDLINGELSVYPNPATSLITINGLDSELMIFDSQGRMKTHLKTNAFQESFDISHFEAGIYIIRTGEESIRFIKL